MDSVHYIAISRGVKMRDPVQQCEQDSMMLPHQQHIVDSISSELRYAWVAGSERQQWPRRRHHRAIASF